MNIIALIKNFFRKIVTVFSHIFSDKKIRIKREYLILAAIIALAYVLRVLPYLLGYPIPFTEDGIRDFQQVKYLIDNSKINLYGSYGNYGAFPVLHILIYGFYLLGFNALKAFLFIPQAFAVLGLVFYYAFLKRYFPIRESLAAVFFIAVFGPHIHWSSQPVRETLGLFFFPLIIWSFDQVMNGGDKRNRAALIALISSSLIIIPTHHWSALMAFIWMIFYAFFFLDTASKSRKAYFFASGFFLAMVAYWMYFFDFVFNLILSPFQKNPLAILAAAALLIILSFVFIILKHVDIGRLRTKKVFFISLLAVLSALCFISAKLLPLDYPLQIWLAFSLYISLAFIGFFLVHRNDIDKFVCLSSFPLIFAISSLPYALNNQGLSTIPFDPFRTLAFVIFPLSIIVALGYFKVFDRFRSLGIILAIIAVFLATLIYPPIFVYHNKFSGTLFYDIRSDIRYISPGIFSLIKQANDAGFGVDSIVPEIRSFQETFYPPRNKYLVLVSKSDNSLQQNFSLIKDDIMKVLDPNDWQSNVADIRPVIENADGALYVAAVNNASFIAIKLPDMIGAGEKRQVSIIVKNIGTKIWHAGKYRLAVKSKDKPKSWGMNAENLTVRSDIKPNETVNFDFSIQAPEYSEESYFSFQMLEIKIGKFGDISTTTTIKVIK